MLAGLEEGGGGVTIIYVIHVAGAIRWQHIPQIPAS